MLTAGGSLSGSVAGGDGGWDTLELEGSYGSVTHRPTGPDSGSVVVDGSAIVYSGLEPVTDNTVVDHRAVVPDLPVSNLDDGQDDVATLGTESGRIVLRSVSSTFEDITFAVLPRVSFTIDLGGGTDQLTVLNSISLPGIDLTLVAETIIVAAGAEISTEDRGAGGVTAGDSGDITLQGEEIHLNGTAAGPVALRAAVDGGSGHDAGDITVAATKAPTAAASIIGDLLSPLLVADNTAQITATHATFTGAEVSLTARGATLTRWDDVGDYWDEITSDLFDTAGELASYGFSLLSPITAQVKIQLATSLVSLDDSTVTAGGAATITAESEADAGFTAIGVNAATTSAPFIIVVGYGQSEADAEVRLIGTTTVTAGGDVTIGSNAVTGGEVTSRITANGVGTSTGDVEGAVSVAILYTEERAHTTIGDDTTVESLAGGVEVYATGEVANEVTSEVAIFLDGSGGGSFALIVDNADLQIQLDGTVTAENTGGSPDVVVDPATDVSGGWITIEVDPADTLERGDEVVYRAGTGTGIGGLEDGETYVVVDVVDSTSPGSTTVTQQVRLALAMSIDLDATQTSPLSTHSLVRQDVVTFDSAAVTNVGGKVTLSGLTGVTAGDVVRYLGPSGSNRVGVESATFSAAGSSVTVTGGPDWDLLPLYVGQLIEVDGTANNDHQFRIAAFSTDGRTMVLTSTGNTVENETVTDGFEILTLPASPTAIGNLTQGKLLRSGRRRRRPAAPRPRHPGPDRLLRRRQRDPGLRLRRGDPLVRPVGGRRRRGRHHRGHRPRAADRRLGPLRHRPGALDTGADPHLLRRGHRPHPAPHAEPPRRPGRRAHRHLRLLRGPGRRRPHPTGQRGLGGPPRRGPRGDRRHGVRHPATGGRGERHQHPRRARRHGLRVGGRGAERLGPGVAHGRRRHRRWQHRGHLRCLPEPRPVAVPGPGHPVGGAAGVRQQRRRPPRPSR